MCALYSLPSIFPPMFSSWSICVAGEFYIASGNSTNTYLTLWDSENKNVGLLDTSIINKEGKKRAKNKIG